MCNNDPSGCAKNCEKMHRYKSCCWNFLIIQPKHMLCVLGTRKCFDMFTLTKELIWHKNTSTTKPVSYGRSFHFYHMTTIFSVDNVINKSGMTTTVINFFKLYLTSSSTMQHYL